ncbi:hypothetical protein ACFQ5N_03685 [Lutibacter holmesii]|uniref:DUF1129 domain-containing protein n=1 Tax=Lutibacter holmesii TaxID=1137985 RepID=A0ABW3WNQ9_9FLAO
MKLTKEQIQEIDDYITACDIKWYDVKMELVDHFATSLEGKLEENPIVDFKQAIIDEHKSFSDQGFKKLLNTKTKAVEKQFYKQVFKHLKLFFTLPKIFISASIFYGLVLLMNIFENKENFFIFLTAILLTLVVQLLLRITSYKKNNKTPFLILNRTNIFLQLFNGIMIIFSNITSFRTEESFYNSTYNYVQIGIFVLIILFYWCAEYVFFMNKKYVKTNYPEIAI